MKERREGEQGGRQKIERTRGEDYPFCAFFGWLELVFRAKGS